MRARYTQEFKLEAVRQVHSGQCQSQVAQVLGLPKATLGNWVRLAAKGQLGGDTVQGKAVGVSPEQMEIARLLDYLRNWLETRANWLEAHLTKPNPGNSGGEKTTPVLHADRHHGLAAHGHATIRP